MKKAALIVMCIAEAILIALGVLSVCMPTLGQRSELREDEFSDRRICFYSEEEREKEPSKKGTYLIPFVVQEGAPFVMVVPGGGYGMVSTRSEGSEVAEEINKLGYNAFVLNYRVGEDAHYPHPQEDLAKATIFVFDHANEFGVAKEYAVMGFSAGGHLCASFGTETVGYAAFSAPKPQAVLLAYPVVTMGEKTHKGSRNNLLADDKNDEKIRKLYSVEEQVTSSYPPTYVWCCKDDWTVSPKNSYALNDALTKCGVKVCLKVYPVGMHGAGVGKTGLMNGWIADAVDFWQTNR